MIDFINEEILVPLWRFLKIFLLCLFCGAMIALFDWKIGGLIIVGLLMLVALIKNSPVSYSDLRGRGVEKTKRAK